MLDDKELNKLFDLLAKEVYISETDDMTYEQKLAVRTLNDQTKLIAYVFVKVIELYQDALKDLDDVNT